MPDLNLSSDFAPIVLLYVVVQVILLVIVQVAFAIAVYSDALALERTQREPVLVIASIWGLATLVGGVFVAGLYWFIHHSTLFPDGDETVDVGPSQIVE